MFSEAWTLLQQGWKFVDVGWIDFASFFVALVFCLVQYWRKLLRTGDDFWVYFGNGYALFPMFLLAIAFFASKVLGELTAASRITLLWAGIRAIQQLVKPPSSTP
jgi:hypothetical protein